jgi:hypothetical protein
MIFISAMLITAINPSQYNSGYYKDHIGDAIPYERQLSI